MTTTIKDGFIDKIALMYDFVTRSPLNPSHTDPIQYMLLVPVIYTS